MDETARWEPGSVIVRREVLDYQPSDVSTPSQAAGVWLEVPVHVVEDRPDRLVTYIAPGARFDFPDGDWPTPDGLHPWSGRTGWTGHGCLMVHQPHEHHAVWHFWEGPDREFSHWYLNLQTSLLRTPAGYDTQDLELDIIVHPDGSYEVKDAEFLDQRVDEGRYSTELIDWVRDYGDGLLKRLENEGVWWDPSWARWTPPPTWG